MITHPSHLCFYLREFIDGVDAEGFARLQYRQGFNAFSGRSENAGAIREIVLALTIVVFEVA